MADNTTLFFHLSRGNPGNDPCGIGLDGQVFGKSIGGKLFRSETLESNRLVYHRLEDGDGDLFDAIVPSDIIKSKINYRAVFITNYSLESVILDSITVDDVVPDLSTVAAISDIDIAVEGLFTVGEVSRPIPNKAGKAGNPSIFLDDEYDSTQKLSALTFKKTLDAFDLPTDIPYNAVLKIWVRRKMTVDKSELPEQELVESFKLNVVEYDSTTTSLTTVYSKLEGRIKLANWYDFTITPGKGAPILLNELLPKSIDISEFNVQKIFVKEDKILIFYFVEPDAFTKNYMLLVIKPDTPTKNNKYIQIQLQFLDKLEETEEIVEKNQIDIHKSFYNNDQFYIFWDSSIKTETPSTTGTSATPCVEIGQFFGQVNETTETTVDILQTDVWTNDEIFKSITPGYGFRRVDAYTVLDNNKVRKYNKLINVEQIDDLFILFSQDTTNAGLLNIANINLNRNQLLYLFEKDILNPKKYSGFTHYTGVGAEVFSQRLYPPSLSKDSQIKSFNNRKNALNNIIISDSNKMDPDIVSNRRIKHLLDGTRYVDINSAHGREFKIENRFVTYELPPDNVGLTNLFVTSSFAVNNDTGIYDDLKTSFIFDYTMDNVSDSVIYEKPTFQKNIIDADKTSSLSIPLEWVDRNYKDEWISIISTLPNVIENNPVFSLDYNFYRNIWRTVVFDYAGNGIETFINKLKGQEDIFTETLSTTAAPPSSMPGGGKQYFELDITDVNWIIEPDVYQPISVAISVQSFTSSKQTQTYQVNFQVYFKGNTEPLVEVSTTTTDLSSLGFIFLNPKKTMSLRVNYFDVQNSKELSKKYYVKNIHNTFLNKNITNYGKELLVNPVIHPEQSEFQYYRKIKIQGFENVEDRSNSGGDVIIPIILYGNSYKNDETNAVAQNLGVSQSFDFTKLIINDKSMRFYTNDNTTRPLDFKVSYYDYNRDFAVIWVKLSDYNETTKKLLMFYGKINQTENVKDVRKSYTLLRNNLYANDFIGAWHFDSIIKDDRLSFMTGKIFNVGEPVIYEKGFNNEITLSKIDKEYFYGIAKVYKSNYLNFNIDIPAEEGLFFDENTKDEFIKFIKDAAAVFQPSYTEINSVKQFGIDILEAGEGTMGESNNRRLAGLVALTPNSNVSTYYERKDDLKFNLLTSFNGYSKKIDWIVSKPIDSSIFKSGVVKISGKTKSETIKFETPFKNKDYFVVFSSPTNQNLYNTLQCENRFVVTGSHFLLKEISWMAFHRDIFGGVYTPDSIFVGKRTVNGSIVTDDGESPTTANLTDWYNNELLIKPSIGIEGDPGSMNLDPVDPGYSLLLTSNKNINMYWSEKEANQFRVKTSSPVPATIHWVVIKNGIEWWTEVQP